MSTVQLTGTDWYKHLPWRKKLASRAILWWLNRGDAARRVQYSRITRTLNPRVHGQLVEAGVLTDVGNETVPGDEGAI